MANTAQAASPSETCYHVVRGRPLRFVDVEESVQVGRLDRLDALVALLARSEEQDAIAQVGSGDRPLVQPLAVQVGATLVDQPLRRRPGLGQSGQQQQVDSRDSGRQVGARELSCGNGFGLGHLLEGRGAEEYTRGPLGLARLLLAVN